MTVSRCYGILALVVLNHTKALQLDNARQCFDLRSGSVMQDRFLQNYKLITVAGTLFKLNATVQSTKKKKKKISSLKQKDGGVPKHTGERRVKLRERRQLILLEHPLK